MSDRKMEQKSFLSFAVVLSSLLIVNLVMAILIATGVDKISSDLHSDLISSNNYAWMSHVFVIWGALAFAVAAIIYLEIKLKSSSVQKINYLALLLTGMAVLVVVIRIATTNTVSTVNYVEITAKALDSKFNNHSIYDFRIYAYVMQGINIAFLVGFGLAFSALAVHMAHLRKNK